MGYKDYDAMLSEKFGGAPTFKAAGLTWTCKPKLPWKKFSTLIISLSVSSATGEATLEQTEKFFGLVLVKSDRQAFLDLLKTMEEDDDVDEVLDSRQVNMILDDLLDFYTGKESSNASNSSTSPPGAGQQSNVTSLTPREATA